jgi:hypothetical protein
MGITPAIPIFSGQIEQWRPMIQAVAPELPINFMLAWLKKESGGNPCATGIPGVEAGIGQTYHPDDDKYGATFAQLRAACAGGSQQQARPLTEDEKALQVTDFVNRVRAAVAGAQQDAAAVGLQWGFNTADFWSLVKSKHGLPVIGTQLLPLVTQQLGRPPTGWSEFHSVVQQIPASSMPQPVARYAASPSTSGRANRLEDIMANAEDTGQYGGGFVTVNNLLKIMILGAGAWGFYQLFKALRRRG